MSNRAALRVLCRPIVAAAALLVAVPLAAQQAIPGSVVPQHKDPAQSGALQWLRNLVGLQPAPTPCSMAAIRDARARQVAPPLVGCSYRDVKVALEEFYPRTNQASFLPHAEPAGIIYDQSPPSGAALARSDELTVDVSTGPPPQGSPGTGNATDDNGAAAVADGNRAADATPAATGKKPRTGIPTPSPLPTVPVWHDRDTSIIYPWWFTPGLWAGGILVALLIGWWAWPRPRPVVVPDPPQQPDPVDNRAAAPQPSTVPAARFSSGVEPDTSRIDRKSVV